MNPLAFFKKSYRYIALHISRDPRYLFGYIVQFCNPLLRLRITFLSTSDLSHNVSDGKSIIRFGDGEIYLLNGGDLPFQPHSLRLQQLLRSSIDSYSTTSPYVFCLNRVPLEKTNYKLATLHLLSCWLPAKVYYWLYFPKNVSYGDAAVFYYHQTVPMYFEQYLQTKKIIFVSNQETIATLRQNKKIPFTDILYVTTPAIDAFAQYDTIKQEVVSAVEQYGKQDAVVVAAFGPASKALAYECAREGIQVLDVGQGIAVAYTDRDHSLSDSIRMIK